jgi:osmoprotectant transport system permease protein
MKRAVILFLCVLAGCSSQVEQTIVRIGSKASTEPAILGDILAGAVASMGVPAKHDSPGGRRLGDTPIVWNALLLGEIDAYVDYTGTLTKEILARENLTTEEELQKSLASRGLKVSKPLGFDNSYALGMKESLAARLGIRTISDLKRHPTLKVGSSAPFVRRADGWEALKSRYALPYPTPSGMERVLVFRALDTGSVDVADIETTAAEVEFFKLRVLEDDQRFFPSYEAVIVYRADLESRAPDAVQAMRKLEGKVTLQAMQAMNRRANIDNESEQVIASDFLREKLGIISQAKQDSLLLRLFERTKQHLLLVVVALILGIVVSVPLGVISSKLPFSGQVVLAIVGLVQTVPALALLSLLIILFRQTGVVPAVVALFAYSLLPIVRNTFTGLRDIPLTVRESAAALGLGGWSRLRLIELPMASPAILAGVKTSAVLTVGFATLGGLVGAGGYGDAIIAGLQRNDTALILEGALPAMAMALIVQGLFELIERTLVPRGLRLRTEAS